MSIDKFNPSHDEDVIELVRELEKSGEDCFKKYKLIAERNELFVSGDQFQDIEPTQYQLADAWKPHLPRVTQNHLRNLLNTWKARLTKDRPSVTAWPTSSNPSAVASAAVSKQLIDYLEKELQIDLLLDEVVKLSGMHSTAGFKIVYNPVSDRIDWNKLSVFDYLIDPTKETFDQADWCLFKTYVNKYDAIAELEAAGIDQPPPVETYRIGDSEEREGVLVLELWHKPTNRIPSGLFCKIIGSHVLDKRPYPYIFQNIEDPNGHKEAVLPIVLMKVDFKRGTPYADTWLSDAIPEQRQINETEATLLRIRRETGNIKLVVPNKSVVQQLNENTQYIISPDSTGVMYVNPPVINSLLFADREYHFKRLYDIAGLNEQLVGVDNVKSGTSAKQIAYLSELDGMKHKGTAQSLETMLVRGWKLTLQLIQYYYINERVMRIASDAGGYETVAFRGADIQGITVDLAPRAGLERMAANRAAQVEMDGQAGLAQPAQVLEARKTGQSLGIAEKITRDAVKRDISTMLQGGTVQVDPSIIAPVAADELMNTFNLLISLGTPREQLYMIEQLAQAYFQKAAAESGQVASQGEQ
jgi:hypothetical protein